MVQHSSPTSTVSLAPKAALVFNPSAGSSCDLPSLRRMLDAHFELVLVCVDPNDANAATERAVALGASLVIAAGGDGTVSTVAGALRGTHVPLGIVPLGTSNSLATALGIPKDLDAAIEILASGQPLTLDTATANGKPMLLHASVGLHAAAVSGASPDAKRRWGTLAYLAEGLAHLADLTPFEVVIETNAEVIRCQAVNVAAANMAPPKTVLAQGPAEISPLDGTLDVTVVTAASFAEAIATGLHLFHSAVRGEPATRDNVGHFSADRVRIETRPPQPVLIDGEAAGDGPLEVTCWPRSLVVLAPA